MNFIKKLRCLNFARQFFCRVKKRRLLSATLAILLTFSLFGSTSYVQSQSVANSLAHAEQSGDELIQTEDIIAVKEIASAVNPDDPYSPTVLPGNVFYPMKNLWRGVRASFTFNPNKKADLRIKYSNEKIIELNSLADLGIMNKVAKELPNYANELNKIEALITKTRIKDPELAAAITKKVMQNQIHHHVVGNKFERETPVEFLAKIRESKDKVTNSIGNLISNLGTPEDIQKALVSDVESLIDNGTEFKQMQALGALKTVGEKVSISAKEALENVDKEYTLKVNNKLDNADSATKDKFVTYSSKNNGDEVIQAQILDDLSTINTNDDSFEKIVKTKENLYKKFNARIADAEKKAPEAIDSMFEHLDDGEIKDLRILKDLERNVNVKLAQDKVKSSKEKTLEEISKNIKDIDQKKFLNNISNKPDVKQLAILNEIEDATNINDPSTANKIDEAKTELVKKISYSVNLMSYDDTTENDGSVEGILSAQSIKKIFNSCIEDGMCSNVKNIDPEDAKIIENNKALLGAQLSDRLIDINKQKVLILIKTLEDLKALNDFEHKLKSNLNPEDIERFANEMNNRTAYIGEMRSNFREDEGPNFLSEKDEKIYCPYEFIPVCGIDGRTYNNRCFAEKISNVKIEYEGQCKLKYFTASGETVLCPREYQPVCGVDGKEYSNRCYAERVAIAQIKYDGKCIQENLTQTQTFNDIGPSVIAKPDQMCLSEYNPVCGEDGRTYQSFCYAEKIAHVRVVSKGKCGETPTSDGLFPTPYISQNQCYPEYSPVCGEDGRTYQSFCYAEKINHVKVIYKGKCGEPILEQDPNKIIQIDPNDPANIIYCDKIYKPVCGVDSKTYENYCVASKINKIEVKHEGECGSQTNTLACPTEYKPVCGVDNRTYDNKCQAEKMRFIAVAYEGVCKLEPEPLPITACTFDYRPVCGVDGKTYSNKCNAENYGKVVISYEGECKTTTNCPANDFTKADGTCNFTKCASGCNWDSTNKCPIGCKTSTTTTCPANDFTNADGKCNYTKCPNGCAFNSNNCPVECSATLTAVCNYNGICENTETVAYCPNDCGTKEIYCDSYTTQATCVTQSICRWNDTDKICRHYSVTTGASCPVNDYTNTDGSCSYTKCPNGCNWNAGCPTECKPDITAYCGNGVCDSGESATNCATDCGTSSSMCEDNTTKELCDTQSSCRWMDMDNICLNYTVTTGEENITGTSTVTDTSTTPYCGDGKCDSTESTSNCATDCPSTEPKYITLSEVKINTGKLQVNYSKNFSTCAHLLNSSKNILHSKNFFCSQGNGIWSDDYLNDFNLTVGDSVMLCDGNNYNLCSSIIQVTGYLEYCGDGICNGYDNAIDCPADCASENTITPQNTSTTTYRKTNPIVRLARDVGVIIKSIFLLTVSTMSRN